MRQRLPLVGLPYEGLVRAGIQASKGTRHGASGGVGHVAVADCSILWCDGLWHRWWRTATCVELKNWSASYVHKTDSVADYVQAHTEGVGFDHLRFRGGVNMLKSF